MARLSPPTWVPADGGDQVTKLPCMTEVTFTVTPRRNLKGFEVEYRLHSARLVVTPSTDDPPLPPDEAAGSTPLPPAIRRDDRVVVDRFDDLTAVTDVTRLIQIELSGAGKPAAATLEVSVFDLTAAGERANEGNDSAELSFKV